MSLSGEQKQIRDLILAEARKRGLPLHGRRVLSAIETGLVESNLRNLDYGDADSQGWRQERASLYKDPTNLRASIRRYFDEAAQHDTGRGSAGQLAARVQRPAAEFRGRYDQRKGDALNVLRGAGATSDTGGSRSARGAQAGEFTVPGSPGVSTDQARRQLIAGYVLSRRRDPVGLATQVAALRAQETPGTPARVVKTSTPGSPSSQRESGGGAGLTARFKSAADRIDAQKLPYKWGGGHGGKTTPGAGVPLDCSGAVSSVLGINPRVSGQFTKFGSPGRAPGGRGLTVYANAKHVLLEIDGHYWGTSGANPGGGAGWIPRSKVSAEYLRGFTARHLGRTVH